MEKYDILNTITSLISSINDSKADITLLGNCTAEDLRELAVYLYFNAGKYPHDTANTLLHNILTVRCRLINQTFRWSKENKAHFLCINEKLTQAVQEADKEASKIFADIDKKVKGDNSYFKDFEIEINVAPFIRHNEDDDCFHEVLAYPKGCHNPISYMFGGSEIYLDKSSNWNYEYFNGEFDKDYIGYAIHALLDTHIWSFQDILEIQTIWTDIKVIYQNSKSIGA